MRLTNPSATCTKPSQVSRGTKTTPTVSRHKLDPRRGQVECRDNHTSLQIGDTRSNPGGSQTTCKHLNIQVGKPWTGPWRVSSQCNRLKYLRFEPKTNPTETDMADIISCRSSLLGRITNMETIISRVSIQLQNLAQHMMYTEYVKRLIEIQFDAKNSLTTI